MKFLKKSARRRERSPRDPNDEQELARDEAFYGVDNLATLDASGLMKVLMIHRAHLIYARLSTIGKRYSMLHPDLLTLLYYLAKHGDGNVLEIGPFVGGSTMAAAIGLSERSRPPKFVTVEKGGKLRHPRLASRDIVRDLRQNLLDHGLAHFVHVVVGWSLGDETVKAVRAYLPPRSVNLFIVDADGEVRSLLDRYHELLTDHCWLVIDDYFATGVATAKSALTKPQIDAAIATEELEELGCYGWGTWVGKWHRASRHNRREHT